MQFRPPHRKAAMISLTPLIDVVFILLTFFMLASSFLDWHSIDLNAPASGRSVASSQSVPLVVGIGTDGAVSLAGVPQTLDRLISGLREQLAANPDRTVIIRPVAGVPVQQTVKILDAVKRAGATSMTLTRRVQQ